MLCARCGKSKSPNVFWVCNRCRVIEYRAERLGKLTGLEVVIDDDLTPLDSFRLESSGHPVPKQSAVQAYLSGYGNY